ncbi:MAG: UspA domain protein [Myxococcales bacterium]|nr:UspA domain protein [Myxococcales bacterium]
MDPKSIKRIVVATDFSDLSREAIDTAVGLARQFGATVDLVHVAAELAVAAPPPMDVVALPINPAAVIAEASRRMADEEGRVRERGIDCESSVLVGRSDAEIVAHADATHSDLIVIATHGRTGLGHALLGSVAEKVVQHAHCPVLTIPERRALQA